MIGTGLAILGAGLLGAGASIYGASKASKTQQDSTLQAAQIQADAQAKALDFQKGVFGQQTANFNSARDASNANLADTRNNLSPFINSGIGANNLLSSFYGLGGGDPAAAQSALAQFQKSPDYTFALKGGSDALDNSAASRGGILSGNQIRAQTEYGSGLATQNLQNYLTRLTGMSTQGQSAAGTLGQIGASTNANLANTGANIGTGIASSYGNTAITGANNIANSIMANGTAGAAGINGMVNGFNGGLNALSLYNQLGKSSFGGGGVTPLSTYGGGTGFSLSTTGGLY